MYRWRLLYDPVDRTDDSVINTDDSLHYSDCKIGQEKGTEMKTIEIKGIEALKEFLESCEPGTVVTLIVEDDNDEDDS